VKKRIVLVLWNIKIKTNWKIGATDRGVEGAAPQEVWTVIGGCCAGQHRLGMVHSVNVALLR
jgi:hypothetical protein